MEGNQMKMREVLLEIAKVADDWERHSNTKAGALDRIYELANTALSEPPRQCDVFNDAESARQAWLNDAENWDEFGSPELELHEWLYASAKSKTKGESDGR